MRDRRCQVSLVDMTSHAVWVSSILTIAPRSRRTRRKWRSGMSSTFATTVEIVKQWLTTTTV